MSFREIDDAKKNSGSLHSNGRRNRKRKSTELIGSTGEEKGNYVSDRRIGRWTNEEIALCDKLIEKFENGDLPMLDGIKLNDFLGNMLKSKQSRLTKKMKNAKLSSKTFERSMTHNSSDVSEAKEFSQLEESFFHAIQCHQERAEIKFHMQKEWRELFSNLCIHIGQPLDADAWLCSVEEMDRRASHAKEAARMARRKLMTGFALRHDAQNSDAGVFIEHADENQLAAEESAAAMILGAEGADTQDVLALLADKSMLESTKPSGGDCNVGSSLLHSAPFLSRALSYMHRHHVPFEHIDLWVPSFVTHSNNGQIDNSTSCRLCYAGNATVEIQVGPDGKSSVPLSAEESFNLSAFGDYSQKFSFDVGCGLPGRVYQSGMPTWEQNVMNAPHHHFERGGGARQWGIKTVVGIPISSPSVGRIVVTVYSRHDRDKDQELVGRLSDEFTRVSET
jgi:flagellar hook-basal body complex protein FliE